MTLRCTERRSTKCRHDESVRAMLRALMMGSCATTLSITTFSITFSVKGLFATLSITTRRIKFHYA